MSLTRKLLITRWLERAKPDERRQWKKHAAVVARRRRANQVAVPPFQQREALLRKLKELVKAAQEHSADAEPAKDAKGK